MIATTENKFYNLLNRYLLTGFNFKVLMIIATMLTSVPYLHYKVGGYVKFILAYGLLVCLWQLFQKETLKKLSLKPSILLCLFSVLYAITIFVNKEVYFKQNIQQLVYMVAFFFLLYIDVQTRPEEQLKRELRQLSLVFVGITFVFSAICFYTFLRQFHYVYVVPTSHAYYRFGISENRLWGLYNPNTGSALNALSILFTLLYLSTAKADRKRLVYIAGAANILLQYCCMILTDSRTAYYGITIVVALMAGVFVLKEKVTGSTARKIFISLVVVAVTIALIVTVTGILEVGLSYLPGVMTSIFGESFSLSDLEPGGTVHWLMMNPISLAVGQVDVNRLPESNVGFLTGRTEIWRAGLEIFKDNPLFGIGREGVAYIVSYALDGGLENPRSNDIYAGGLHNIYVTVLVCSGIFGFIVFMTFLFANILPAAKAILKSKDIDMYLLSTFGITIFFLISEVFEARILYQVSIFNVLFWCVIGYLFAFTSKRDLEDMKNG